MAGNYKQIMVLRGEEHEVNTLRHARSVANELGMEVGEIFDLYRECSEKHRRSPNRSIRRRYEKIHITKACRLCDRIVRTRTRIVLVKEHWLNCRLLHCEDGPCDSPYCQAAYSYIEPLNLSYWERRKINGYLEDWHQTVLFRTSQYPELVKYRYCNEAPSCIINDLDRPMRDYMEEWWEVSPDFALPPVPPSKVDHYQQDATCTEEEWEVYDQILLKHYFETLSDEALAMYDSELAKDELRERQEKAEVPSEVVEQLELEEYLDENQLDGYDPEELATQ